MAIRRAQANLTSVSSNIIPSANVTYDLGTANNSWKDLFLSGNTISIGGASIKAGSNTIIFVPPVSNTNPNPKATVISTTGVTTVDTVGGTPNTTQLSTASSASIVNKTQKTYNYRGALEVNVGTLRYYISSNSTITSINSYVSSNGSSSVIASIKKNGTQINTVTIPSSSRSNTQTDLTSSLSAGDYITVDITQAGGASDLYINITYQDR